MRHSKKILFFAFVMFFLSVSLSFAGDVGIFAQRWNFPVLGAAIAIHALDSVGQLVYVGSSLTTGPTNYLYALNISNGETVWQYNTSLPVNYVSHFRSNGDYYVAAGTGGSSTTPNKSYVFCFNLLNDAPRWNSTNLVSSVKFLGSAASYVTTEEDVIAGLENGTIVRLRGDNGQELWRYSCIGTIVGISQLKNGSVVVGSSETSGTPTGHIYCFEKNGTPRWERPPRFYPLDLVKKFGDVNGDGEPDVIAVFRDGFIRVFDGTSGEPVLPWPFDNEGDSIKDLLCTEDYTGDGFPDVVGGTDGGNLTIVDGLTAMLVRRAKVTNFTVSYIQYMYFYENGFVYLNKTLAVSVQEYVPTSSYPYFIRGVNVSDLSVMKEYSVASRAQNLFHIGNSSSPFVGDLIFTVNNVAFCITGDEIITPEFSSQIILVVLIIVMWFLIVSLRRKGL